MTKAFTKYHKIMKQHSADLMKDLTDNQRVYANTMLNRAKVAMTIVDLADADKFYKFGN